MKLQGMKWLGIFVLAGTACVTARGTGGSGYVVDPDAASARCVKAAKKQGFDDPRPKTVSQSGNDTAEVLLTVDSGLFSHDTIACHYDARNDRASVPLRRR